MVCQQYKLEFYIHNRVEWEYMWGTSFTWGLQLVNGEGTSFTWGKPFEYIGSKWDIFCKNISFAYEWVFGMVLNWWEDSCLKNMFLEPYGITEDKMPHLHLIWIKGIVGTLNSLDCHKIGSLSLWKISLNCCIATSGQGMD